MVTFETKVYENDWKYLLRSNWIDQMILNCNYAFKEKVLFINNVKDIEEVKKYANLKINSGTLDRYHIVEDFASEALKYFDLSKESFSGGYYYSISELVSIYLCTTEYLLHFSSDSYVSKSEVDWIDKSIAIFENNDDIVVSNPTWNFKFEEARDESFSEIDDFYLGFGFSDQCYLIKRDIFRNAIYNERHIDSERYPRYGGELFEKRVDSYMRNHNLKRITSKEVSYVHKNFPKSRLTKALYNVLSKTKLGVFQSNSRV